MKTQKMIICPNKHLHTHTCTHTRIHANGYAPKLKCTYQEHASGLHSIETNIHTYIHAHKYAQKWNAPIKNMHLVFTFPKKYTLDNFKVRPETSLRGELIYTSVRACLREWVYTYMYMYIHVYIYTHVIGIMST
jgi:hypothetical protein